MRAWVTAGAVLAGAWACAPLIGLDDAEQIADDGGAADGSGGDGGSAGSTDCWGSAYKICDGDCPRVDDPSYGCSPTACAPCALPFADATCAGGSCEIASCAAGYADCDVAVANHHATGCETSLLTSNANCGACGNDCFAIDATKNWACNDGACAETNCPIGSANCGPNGECESISTDPSQCGACDTPCNLINAVASCVSAAPPAIGQCVISSCLIGWANCDGNHATGCEVKLSNSLAHCGACGTACTAPAGGVATCDNGQCDFSCIAPKDQCGNACVDKDTDVNHCGGCGDLCPAPVGGTSSCVNGVCVQQCPGSLTLCSGLCVNLYSDDKHCGSCNQPCVGGHECLSGFCN